MFYHNQQERNTNSILEGATNNGQKLVMGQRYLPEIRQGDKRIIVLNGEPLGAVLRVPLEEETRGNIHVGGQCVRTDITPRDREICEALSPLLRQDGLYFVGLDVIGNYLTENFAGFRLAGLASLAPAAPTWTACPPTSTTSTASV